MWIFDALREVSNEEVASMAALSSAQPTHTVGRSATVALGEGSAVTGKSWAFDRRVGDKVDLSVLSIVAA